MLLVSASGWKVLSQFLPLRPVFSAAPHLRFERGPVAVELYAHRGDLGSPDYDAWENENVAESNPDAVASLLAMARTHWAKPKARGNM